MNSRVRDAFDPSPRRDALMVDAEPRRLGTELVVNRYHAMKRADHLTSRYMPQWTRDLAPAP